MNRTYSKKRKTLPSSPPSTRKIYTAETSSPQTPLYSSSPSRVNQLDASFSSPTTSPIRAPTPSAPKRLPKRARIEKPAPKMTQLRLNIGNGAVKRQQCPECGMSYLPIDPRDAECHKKFHSRAFEGREWSTEYGRVAIELENGDKVYRVDASSKPVAKRAVEDLMALVNMELDAPAENSGWRDVTNKGAAFVYVRKSSSTKKPKALGIVVVEKVCSAKWMGVQSGEIVCQDIVPVLMGISRIYTARNFRRERIAYELLEVARKKFVYGVEILTTQVAWSQPSESGGKVADKWCGVEHDNERRVLTYTE